MSALCFALLSLLIVEAEEIRPTVVIAVGTPGDEEYAQNFSTWADRWEAAAKEANANIIRIGDGPESDADSDEPDDHSLLKQAIGDVEESNTSGLWLVLIGHGTFDGQRAKFNLRGPDVTAQELSDWLKPMSLPVAVINCASSSGPFINRLSGPDRVIVTATKSGYEQNYARFGEYISSAITDPEADLDKDGQTSLLEAFLAASAGVQDFYKQEGRLATEHALIDDNGDALGTSADWFRGYRAVRTAKEGSLPDGQRANQFVLIPSAEDEKLTNEQRQTRDRLELELERLRSRKDQLSEEEYYRQLEPVLLDLARLYKSAEQASDAEK